MHDAGNICRVLTITNLEVKLKECILWEGCSRQEGFVLERVVSTVCTSHLGSCFPGTGGGQEVSSGGSG